MPPAQKAPVAKATGLLEVGQLCNLVVGGRTLQNYEFLGSDSNYLKFRGNVQIAPQTEIVLFHHTSIEGIGLVGAH